MAATQQQQQRTTAVTIKQVALEAGVSKTTAVCVLNETPHFNVPEATRRRVRDAAERLGYRRNALAAALSRGRIHTVGVVLPLPLTEDTPADEQVYARELLVAAATAAARVSLRITPVAFDPALPLSEGDVADQRVDGLILASLRDDGFARRVFATGFPCVSIGSGYSDRRVRMDNQGGAALAVAHLAGLGHRRIAHWASGGQSGEERLGGFRVACAAHGIAAGDASEVQTAEELRDLLALPSGRRPTAVFAFNDWFAYRALGLAREAGLSVPGDLSVVGFDDNILSQTSLPPLTTIRNPLAEQMTAALDVLAALWRGEAEPPLPPPIPTRLVVRDSTAPVPV